MKRKKIILTSLEDKIYKNLKKEEKKICTILNRMRQLTYSSEEISDNISKMKKYAYIETCRWYDIYSSSFERLREKIKEEDKDYLEFIS